MHAFRIVWEWANRHQRQHGIFGFDREADIRAAQLLAKQLGRKRLSERTAESVGLALHYLYGSALGAGYAAVQTRIAWLSEVHAVPIAVLLWLFADELPVTIIDISNPCDRSMRSHSSALAAHLIYAATVKQALRRCD